MKYGYTKKVNLSFTEAVEKIKEALKTGGFGVLTEIDVKATMKQKLDVDYEEYVILGACNPQFAHRALTAEKEIGLLLPCNVIVYQDGGDTFVSAIVPTVAMSVVENEALAPLAKEVEERLLGAVNSLE